MKNFKIMAAIIAAALALTGCANEPETVNSDISGNSEEKSEESIVLTEEQSRAIEELYKEMNPDFGRFPYQEKVITGEIDPNAPKLDLATAKKIIADHNDLKEILSEFAKIQKYPDYVGGSGVTSIIYQLSEDEAIGILYEQGEIDYLAADPDGVMRSCERLFLGGFTH